LSLFQQSHQATTSNHSIWFLLFASLSWCLLIFASSRPQWIGDPVQLPITGRDLMLAIDLSGSMQEKDFQYKGRMIDRLTATQLVASEFIEKRVGDRIGLILFGDRAYLQAPLTFDRKTVKTFLLEAVIGLAGKQTAIGDSIGLAIKRLRQQKTESKVLILLTDGANTAGEVSPIKAAELAAEEGLKIYTIGIGADEMVVSSFFGRQKVNPSADLDEKTLKKMASLTGGQYFRAKNTEELNEIYQLLDKLEPIEKDHQHFRPTKALYPWPLGIAFLLSFIIVLANAKGRFQ